MRERAVISAMARHAETMEKERPEDGLTAAVREKYRLVVILAALAVINLASQHFRHHGLSGKEMLIGTLVLAAALVLYSYVCAVWDVKVRRKPLGTTEGSQHQS